MDLATILTTRPARCYSQSGTYQTLSDLHPPVVVFYSNPPITETMLRRTSVLKRESSPLNNPPIQRDAVAVAPNNHSGVTGLPGAITNSGDSDRGKDKRGSRGGKTGGSVVAALVQCAMCDAYQTIVTALKTVPEWHRCIKCGELQPMDGYRLLVYGWPPAWRK